MCPCDPPVLHLMKLTLEHIDPRKGVLVCGLCNEFNEIFADLSYNSRKTNRFVPYRVCNYPAPITFGDIGEFLIQNEWTVCEFGGTEWWSESNQIGNSTTWRGKTNCSEEVIEMRKRFGRQMSDYPQSLEARTKNGYVYGRENAKKVNAQVWMSTADGYISNPGAVAIHNKHRGFDKSARVKLTPEEAAFIYAWN